MLGLKNLFKRETRDPEPGLPEGHRLYCIGDIHGRCDLLAELLEKIRLDREGYSGEVIYIYLGDYIDRGEASKEVIDLLIGYDHQAKEVHFLRGNHEQVMLDFLEEPLVGRDWFNFGGLNTLVSYQVAIAKLPTSPADFEAVRLGLLKVLPEAHKSFLEQTKESYTLGECYFVHAGIDPSRTLTQQTGEDLLWIRDAFMSSRKRHEKLIIHGHTIEDIPAVRHNRIGLDTGAYATNALTCGVFEEESVRFLQTGE